MVEDDVCYTCKQIVYTTTCVTCDMQLCHDCKINYDDIFNTKNYTVTVTTCPSCFCKMQRLSEEVKEEKAKHEKAIGKIKKKWRYCCKNHIIKEIKID